MSEHFSQFITVSGPDAIKFLQGQVTADLNLLDSQQYILSCYCNRQGRVISVFYITKNINNDGYVLIFLGNTAEIFTQAITKYSVFSKVDFSDIHPLDKIEDFIDNKLCSDMRLKLNIEYCINSLIPIISPDNSGVYLPDNLNLINLNAVSFKKGCFLGQEIIARIYYKGKTKKTLQVTDSSTQNDGALACYNDLALIVK